MRLYFTVDNASISQIVESDQRFHKGNLRILLIKLGRRARYIGTNGRCLNTGDCLLMSVASSEEARYGGSGKIGVNVKSVFRSMDSEDYCVGRFSKIDLVDGGSGAESPVGIDIPDRTCLMDLGQTRIELDLAGVQYVEIDMSQRDMDR